MHGKARAGNNFMLVESIRCMYACERGGGGMGGGIAFQVCCIKGTCDFFTLKLHKINPKTENMNK